MRGLRVGDRVRILPDVGWSEWFRPYVGTTATVQSVFREDALVLLYDGRVGEDCPLHLLRLELGLELMEAEDNA